MTTIQQPVKVRIMRVRFQFPLKYKELGAFRGALVEHIGRQVYSFHNHAPGKNNFLYRYPVIQYRIQHGQAALIAVGSGAEDLIRLLDGPAPKIRIHDRSVQLVVDDAAVDYYSLETTSVLNSYEVRDYLPLNQDNEREFQALDEYAQGDYLSRLLTGHLLAVAKGLNWRIEDRIRVEISAVRPLPAITYKGIRRVAFDIRFRSNVNIFPGLGLGKAVAMGFGVVDRINNTNSSNR